MSHPKRPPSIRIRELQLADVPAVIAIGNRGFNDQTLPLLHQTWGETEVLNNYTSDPEFCLVAEAGGQLAGFTLGSLMIPDPAKRAARAYGWLLWIAVQDEFRRCGVAAKLAGRLGLHFKRAGAKFMLVNSATENIAAVTFFQKRGFCDQSQHTYLTRPL